MSDVLGTFVLKFTILIAIFVPIFFVLITCVQVWIL
jgi:hypothetical protein